MFLLRFCFFFLNSFVRFRRLLLVFAVFSVFEIVFQNYIQSWHRFSTVFEYAVRVFEYPVNITKIVLKRLKRTLNRYEKSMKTIVFEIIESWHRFSAVFEYPVRVLSTLWIHKNSMKTTKTNKESAQNNIKTTKRLTIGTKKPLWWWREAMDDMDGIIDAIIIIM